MIHLQNICFEIEKFCDVKLTSSEHVDTRPSRIARDNEDAARLSEWLSEHNPFPKIGVIMSIDSGIEGEDVKPAGSQYVVVDGGHLLHKIVWRQQATFGAIADRYVQYLNNKYGQDIAVIFDGFPDDDKKSTKNCERLRSAAHFSPDQAVEDADLTIVNTAIFVAPQYDYVRVVGEDIDLIVLLTALASTHALFGQGKNKFINLFLKHEELLIRAATFLNPQATTEQVREAGGNVLVALYGGDPATQNLDALRYHSFVKAAAKTKFNLARLPPTTDAGQLHAMRSYHQVQTWLGNENDPLKWGWMHTPSGLFPKKSEKVPAPESLLQCISCTCKKVCTNACRCRKAGLHCSLLCKHCIGQSCENPIPVILDNEFEKGEAPAPIDMIDEQLECEDIEL
ncbi:hypothetical protein AVEN_60737-1 [Araneus ventricosus]|uniref:Tesmin/TSO1-like CXC domain-containing protein n=1 Tax=Araneus ventricosus TaxID=182803 RepID=A0A4Y2IWE9_ARAVE|nr:hypothetical protein AVEN_245281-1 [Araneus ventricosus]GBM81978.1 hypothetical protein AVEN_60737-1 [Araneus ventricosus]